MKMYTTERTQPDWYGACQYRFVSLINGMRGTWFYSKEKAVEQGEKHQLIMASINRKSVGVEVEE
jgi:hypothetical protein